MLPSSFMNHISVPSLYRLARFERNLKLISPLTMKVTHQPASCRTFFGIGEVIGILANPGETLRSLADSKRLLEETRAEMLEQQERAQIPPKHTFSPLPGFYHREKEIKALETCLSSVPAQFHRHLWRDERRQNGPS
ncbi:uncharacterized protein MELLADRAFT_71109 [Melampsora larici-populina 98AG31]|uniref:Uncharacterized protein n=1 Tax=Melampsora larici-populina (strain 98AG31 / pathotype 3-4-7) TaxID=747676 RepID=F4RCD5_MELLP|nr:uncharacterized protein MELLADRAFT_71109 [Melampsora larici-populina 98AG31]EGG09978.1 hypothetical protein MELLADRAFT_71109 [Melampsora larici-populina 98AG31]